MFQGYNLVTWTVVVLQVRLTPLPVTNVSQPNCQIYYQVSWVTQSVLWIRPPVGVYKAVPLSICVHMFVFSRRWVVWSQQRSSSMQTISSKALLHHSPSFFQLSYRTSGSRTSTPQSTGNSRSLSFYLIFVFFFFHTVPKVECIFCSRPQRVLPGGHFGYCGYFPVRLRRQAFPQPQQGIVQSRLTLPLQQQEVLSKQRDEGWRTRKEGERSLSYIGEQEKKVKNESVHNAVMVSHTRSASAVSVAMIILVPHRRTELLSLSQLSLLPVHTWPEESDRAPSKTIICFNPKYNVVFSCQSSSILRFFL